MAYWKGKNKTAPLKIIGMLKEVAGKASNVASGGLDAMEEERILQQKSQSSDIEDRKNNPNVGT